MREIKFASVVLLGAVMLSSLAVGVSKYNLSSKRLSTNSVAISCQDHADPAGSKLGDVLIISCTPITNAEKLKAIQ